MKRIATLIAALAVLLPSTAIAAGSSTCQSYNPQLCQVAGNSASRTTTTTPPITTTTGNTTTGTTTNASTLPFTGLDVVFLAAGGGTLLGAGLVVRRLSRGA
jgi:hypothetical protein